MMGLGRFILLLGGVVFCAALFFVGFSIAESLLPLARAEIHQTRASKTPFQSFTVEVATTPEAMRQGLMFRTELESNRGMLFVFRKNRQARFWMRNTLLGLDMLFIKEDGEIETIVTRYDTGSDEASMSWGRVRYVLEINAGLSHKRGIRAGHYVRIKKPE